jgi:hypothetical protein
LLHGKPAKAIKVFNIPLSRPRIRKQIFTEEFERIRLNILQEEDYLYVQAKLT